MRNIEGLPGDPSRLDIDFSSTEGIDNNDRIERLTQGAERLIEMEAYRDLTLKIKELLNSFGSYLDIPEHELSVFVESGDLAEINMARAIAKVLEEKK